MDLKRILFLLKACFFIIAAFFVFGTIEHFVGSNFSNTIIFIVVGFILITGVFTKSKSK